MYFGLKEMFNWLKNLVGLDKPIKKPVRKKRKYVRTKKVAKKSQKLD